jgi:phosphoserine aminotransferase
VKKLFIFSDPSQQSKTTIMVKAARGSAYTVNSLSEKAIVTGRGYGGYNDSHIRIANFPAHSTDDVTHLVSLL